MRGPRRIILLVSLALAVAFGTLLVRSRFAADSVMRARTGAEPGKPPIGGPPAWMVVSRAWVVGHDSGNFFVVHALVAIEGFDARPSAERIAPFLRADGWKTQTSKPGGGFADMHPKSFYQGIAQWRAAGFGCFSSMAGPAMWRTTQVPLWLLTALSGVPAVLILRGERRRRRRLREGRCVGCGYDLSSAMLVCPECGRDVPGRLDSSPGGRPAA